MFISLNTSIYIWVYLASPEYHDSFSMNQILQENDCNNKWHVTQLGKCLFLKHMKKWI